MEVTTQQIDELNQLVSQRQREGLRALLGRMHPADAAALLLRLDGAARRRAFQMIPTALGTALLDATSVQDQMELIEPLGVQRMAMLLAHLPSYRVADFLSDINDELAQELLSLLGPRESQAARRLLSHPRDTAGRIMSTDYLEFPVTATVGQVRRHLQSLGTKWHPPKAIYVYVVDHQKLVGVVQPGELFFNPTDRPLGSMMKSDVAVVSATMDREEAAQVFRRYHLPALPVVDMDQRLLGVITADDVIETIQEEATEDILKLGGIVSGEESHDLPVMRIVRKRLSWLSFNIILNLLSASVIAFFQETIRAVVVLAVFLPIISDMSGCSGMQAVAVSIRDLALGRIAPRDFRWVLGKELLVGLINGCVLGLQIGLVAWAWKRMPMLGGVVAVALWINTIVSVGIGSVVPLLLKRFRLDPAIASGPILTTVTDICGFFTLLGLATLALPYLVSP